MSLAYRDLKTSSAPPLLKQGAIRRLVVFRALQVGDMLCAVPALRALRAALPETRITLVGLPWAEQFAHRFHKYIDDFIAFPGHAAFPEQAVNEAMIPVFYEEMQKREYDLALQMHGSGQISNQIVGAFDAKKIAGCIAGAASESAFDRQAFLCYPERGSEPERLLQLIEFLGAPAQGTHLEFPLAEPDWRELEDSGLAAGLLPGSYICVHPGARIRAKCWPPQRFAAIADKLAEESGLTVVLTGSAKESDLTSAVAANMRHKAVNAAAPISLGAMAALMSEARLLVCNDTGVSHIAAGLRLPSVIVFSKADMERWAPLDRDLHLCVQDLEGKKTDEVLRHARALLARQTEAMQAQA